jgi:hypothetical protein
MKLDQLWFPVMGCEIEIVGLFFSGILEVKLCI